MPDSLQRFHQRANQGWHQIALRELRNGRKTSHWMWWVFPQLNGLGTSRLATEYALEDDDEALSFLADPTLLANLVEVTEAVVLALGHGHSPETLMGGQTDVRKLVSSLTLFALVCDPEQPPQQHLRTLCQQALTALDAHGFPQCSYTRDALGY